MSGRRVALVAFLIVIWVVAAAGATLSAVRPAAVPPLPSTHLEAPNGAPRLSRHVLFVVVDGLRWDIAHDVNRMPRFSAALRTRPSGELWAGRITMTSSAVLSFGTGQRGGLDQILENLHPPRLGFNDWLQNAKRAGLRLMGVGDRAWMQLYGEAFDEFRPDPEGLAIEADFNALTFRNARELQLKSPDFLVAHFVTPDHQGHAYGIQSPRYARHIREFDRALFDWLDSLTPDWTVIVTSDHGATDSGTHGTDTTVQRWCPLTAWGPGIRQGIERAVDQTDVPGLLSALLGVETAEQSRGTVPFEWLDVTPNQMRSSACGEVRRLSALVGPGAAPVPHAPPDDCVAKARQLASQYDVEMAKSRVGTSSQGWRWTCLAVVAAFLAALSIFGRRAVIVTGVGLPGLLASLALTYGVERLPGVWPNIVRAFVFLVAATVLLVLATRFGRWATQLERHWALTLSVIPGLLLVSYPANAQVAAYAVVIVLGWLLANRSNLVSGSPRRHGRDWPTTAVLVGCFALLALPGTRVSDVCPSMFTHAPRSAAVIAGILLASAVAWILREFDGSIAGPVLTDLSGPQRQERAARARLSWIGVGIVLLSFTLRHLELSWVGRSAWVGCGLCATMALVAGKRRLALIFGLASYAWVSRDFECLILGPSLVAAAVVGRRSLTNRLPVGSAGRTAWRWLDITFLFALSTLQWVGLQGGLQLTTMDFAAGTFGDAHGASWLIGLGLVCKFVLAEAILVAVYLRESPLDERPRLLLCLIAAHLARGACLLLMLAFCGHSYWTAFRVVANLPFALGGLLVITVLYAFRASPTNANT